MKGKDKSSQKKSTGSKGGTGTKLRRSEGGAR